MTTTIGGLSTSVIAVIAVGGIGLLLILIVFIGFCCDLPARLRRRKAAKERRTRPQLNDVDVEKNQTTVSIIDLNDQSSQISKSTQYTRAPSPLCTCEHPNIVINETAVQVPRMHARPGQK
jgi:hypothetical protein